MVEANHVNKTIISNENFVDFDDRKGRFTCLDPEVLASRILEESPDAIEAFNSVEEMVEYIREAMSANYLFEPKSGVFRDLI